MFFGIPDSDADSVMNSHIYSFDLFFISVTFSWLPASTLGRLNKREGGNPSKKLINGGGGS